MGSQTLMSPRRQLSNILQMPMSIYLSVCSNSPSSGPPKSHSDLAFGHTALSPQACGHIPSTCLQLKIVDWHNVERASDALSINGYEHYQAKDYALEACYLPSNSRHDDHAEPSTPSRDFTKWWLDGEEPQYYLVSPKVPHPTGPCHSAEWGGKGARGWAARSVNK